MLVSLLCACAVQSSSSSSAEDGDKDAIVQYNSALHKWRTDVQQGSHTHTGRLTLQPTSQLRSNSDQLNNRSESRSGCQPTEVGCIAKCVLQCCCCCQQQMESCPVPNTDMNQVKVVMFVCPKRAKNSQRGRFRSSVTKSCDCVAAINCKLIPRNTDKVYSYTLLVLK